ncbi:Gfo/Idh/MocA family oxidoreductase [Chromobacterium vaccinii]|uniref:Gfo/Idh/MocA family oxidoreductase n=1 Tax=Chromobacterium vaccinii TaxID=1108595 RepID=UPI0031D7CFB7
MLLLIGSGSMAVEYAKVLKAQGRKFAVIGRGATSAAEFTEKTGVPVQTGGLDAAIASGLVAGVTSAIVSVGVEALYETSVALLRFGVKHLLIEKPGLMRPDQIGPLQDAARLAGARVYIAYNRRFLASVRRAREIIENDGGLTSFTFDFTEWGHEIVTLTKAPGVKELWALGNSSHVLDLAFHLGGVPAQLHATCAGALDWHPASAVFVGSGVTTSHVPFSYHADWDAPGRWGLEFCTRQHKLIFRPMEKLQVMRKGSVQIEEVAADLEDARLDAEYKPGLFRQVEAFYAADTGVLCTLDELAVNLEHFCAIAGYARSA